jgi:hypothetical protein
MPATTMLIGTRPNKTTRSGSLPKVMRPKASAATSKAAGRWRCGIKSFPDYALSSAIKVWYKTGTYGFMRV